MPATMAYRLECTEGRGRVVGAHEHGSVAFCGRYEAFQKIICRSYSRTAAPFRRN